MYSGEVDISQKDLDNFMKLSKDLGIGGLSENNGDGSKLTIEMKRIIQHYTTGTI